MCRSHSYARLIPILSVYIGYRYGKSLVPISEADEKALKFVSPRCLSLMGFTKLENVKQHQCIGTSVLVLTANPDDEVRVQTQRALVSSGIHMRA